MEGQLWVNPTNLTDLAWSDPNVGAELMQNQTNVLIFKVLILPVSQWLSHFPPAIEVVNTILPILRSISCCRDFYLIICWCSLYVVSMSTEKCTEVKGLLIHLAWPPGPGSFPFWLAAHNILFNFIQSVLLLSGFYMISKLFPSVWKQKKD